jgi:hypothetical protein
VIWLTGAQNFGSDMPVKSCKLRLPPACLVIEAGDYERMLFLLVPIMTPAVALALDSASRTARVSLGLTLPLQFVFANPYVTQLTHEAYQYGLMASVGISALVCLFVARSAIDRPFREYAEAGGALAHSGLIP